jgi:hypothetical protein
MDYCITDKHGNLIAKFSVPDSIDGGAIVIGMGGYGAEVELRPRDRAVEIYELYPGEKGKWVTEINPETEDEIM